jgi:hypothetical protein
MKKQRSEEKEKRKNESVSIGQAKNRSTFEILSKFYDSHLQMLVTQNRVQTELDNSYSNFTWTKIQLISIARWQAHVCRCYLRMWTPHKDPTRRLIWGRPSVKKSRVKYAGCYGVWNIEVWGLRFWLVGFLETTISQLQMLVTQNRAG